MLTHTRRTPVELIGGVLDGHRCEVAEHLTVVRFAVRLDGPYYPRREVEYKFAARNTVDGLRVFVPA